MTAQPTEKQLEALKAAQTLERKGTVFINPAYAEECVERGWLEPRPGGGWSLTREGRRFVT